MAAGKSVESAYWLGVVLGAVAGAAVGGAGVYLYGQKLGDYGSAMFVGLPVVQGMVAAYVTQLNGPRRWGACAGATLLSLTLSAVILMVFAIEGAICLLMASPLIIGLGLLGSWLGWLMNRGGEGSARLALVPIAALGATFGGGAIVGAPEASGEVITVWHLAAPPEKVWPYVMTLPSLPEPDWWMFRAGIAYPVRTRTYADGSRECILSTGPMPEVVTGREENRWLRFKVLATPPAMKEMNPFGEVNAPHLKTAYRAKEGEFRLYPEGTGTRVVATSRYGLRMGPAWYWQIWSDTIVRKVHERVVREIGERSLGH